MENNNPSYLQPFNFALVNSARRNKQISKRLLLRTERAYLDLMDKHQNDTYIPAQTAELLEAGGFTRQTFYGNFADLNAMLYWAARSLVDGLEDSLVKKPIRGDLETAFFWTLKYLADNPTEAEFCIRRFDGRLWVSALHPIANLIQSSWIIYDEDVTSYMFRFFASEFREVLLLFLDEGLSFKKINTFTPILLDLAKAASQRLLGYFMNRTRGLA